MIMMMMAETPKTTTIKKIMPKKTITNMTLAKMIFLADLGKARGCSTNTSVTH